VDGPHEWRAVKLGKDGNQYVEEDVLNLEHSVNDAEDANDCEQEVRLFRGELVLKAFDTVDDVGKDSGLERGIREQASQHFETRMDEQRDDGFSSEQSFFTSSDKVLYLPTCKGTFDKLEAQIIHSPSLRVSCIFSAWQSCKHVIHHES
jgi:hypothetical protein